MSIQALKGSVGLFISPVGEIVQVHQSHINTVILDPPMFGITTQRIESIYAKYNESLGIEGSAREEILCELIMRGWIRLRRYIKPREQWSVTVNDLDNRTRLRLHHWAGKMLAGGLGFTEDDPHKPVVISELGSRSITYASILETSLPEFLAKDGS